VGRIKKASPNTQPTTMKIIHSFRNLFLIVLVFALQIQLKAATYYWYPQNGSTELSTPGNWVTTAKVAATVINNVDYLFFQPYNTSIVASHYNAELNNDLTVQRFYADTGTITLYKNLTIRTSNPTSTSITTTMQFNSPFKFNRGTGGKITYLGLVNINFYFYDTLILDSLFCPSGSGITSPNKLDLRSCSVTKLASDVQMGEFIYGPASTTGPTAGPISHLVLNGKKFTCKRFSSYNYTTNTRIIGDENAEIILYNSTFNSTGFNFSQNAGENLLKAFRILRDNGVTTTLITDKIRLDLIICEELELHPYARLLTEGNLILRSTKDKSCKVKTPFTSANCLLGDTLNGSITAQLYIPAGRRVFRYIANPISYNLPISELTDDIDITGNGGATNGFTSTTTNNPSCFIFDASISDGSTTGLDAGWKEFTSASSSSKTWLRHQGVLTYIRGAKGEGLDGTSYSPTAVTLDITGLRLNTGVQTVNLSTSANSTWVSVGNPYVHPIEIGNQPSSQRSNVGNNFYVFDANLGTNGGFITQSFGTSYVLPAFGGFFTTLTGTSTSGSIIFKETDKSVATADNVFTDLGSSNRLKIEILKSNRLYDQTELVLDSSKTLAFDLFDAEKMSNFDLNLFTQSADGKKLAINYAQFFGGQLIPLGIETAESGDFMFQIPNNSFPQDQYKLILLDAKNGSQTELITGNKYAFKIDLKDKSTFENRFAIQIDALQNTAKMNSVVFSVYPNPTSANNGINLISNESIIRAEIFDLQGKLVQKTDCNQQKSLKISFENNLTEGMYLMKISGKTGTSTQKINIQ
jgi:hypothetical protein